MSLLPEPLRRRWRPSDAAVGGRSDAPADHDVTMRLGVEGSDEIGTYAHTLAWVDGTLRSWDDGLAARVDAVIDGSTVRIGDWAGPVLGAHTLSRATDGWTIVGVPATRLAVVLGGDRVIEYDLVWRQPDLTVRPSTPDPAELRIAMPLGDALDWLWGDLLLGHLLWRDRLPLDGNVFALSAIEGIVSAPSPDDTPHDRIDVLRRLAALIDNGALDAVASSLEPERTDRL